LGTFGEEPAIAEKIPHIGGAFLSVSWWLDYPFLIGHHRFYNPAGLGFTMLKFIHYGRCTNSSWVCPRMPPTSAAKKGFRIAKN